MNAQSLENCLLVCFLRSWKTNLSRAVLMLSLMVMDWSLAATVLGQGLHSDGLLANGGTTSPAKRLLLKTLSVMR